MGTTKASVSLEDYLAMSFDGPDAEYVAGEIVERNLGEKAHSRAQKRLLLILSAFERTSALVAYPELRLRLLGDTCRIPDVCAFLGGEPAEDVPSTPPYLAIEIVSREDRYSAINEKLAEYLNWGVIHVWLVDPWKQRLHVFSEEGLTAVRAFDLPELGVQLTLAGIFSD